jgi:hypothetical protein
MKIKLKYLGTVIEKYISRNEQNGDSKFYWPISLFVMETYGSKQLGFYLHGKNTIMTGQTLRVKIHADKMIERKIDGTIQKFYKTVPDGIEYWNSL